MSTEFLYREKDGSGCEVKLYSLHSPGGFMSGPRALRRERLRWLTTPAANTSNRRCFSEKSHNFSGMGGGHRAIWGPGRSGISPQNTALDAGLSAMLFSMKFHTGRKPGSGIPLHFSVLGAAMR